MAVTQLRAKFLRIAPALPVPDVRAAAEFYRDRLGFAVTDLADEFAMLDRDGMKIQLWRGEARGGLEARGQYPGRRDFTLWVDDVDAAHDEFCANGLPVLEGPEDFPYGLRHAVYHDLNGYVILLSGPCRRAVSDGAS